MDSVSSAFADVRSGGRTKFSVTDRLFRANPPPPDAMRRYLLFLTLPLFLLDFITKEWCVRTFAPPTESSHAGFPVVAGFFNLVRVHNTGIAFGMANGTSRANWIFGGVSLAALGFIAWLWKTNAFPTRLSQVAVALLLSGIFGNLLDRILRGYVVDFLDFEFNGYHWPAFNVADSAICIAAGLLFLSAFQKETAAPANH